MVVQAATAKTDRKDGRAARLVRPQQVPMTESEPSAMLHEGASPPTKVELALTIAGDTSSGTIEWRAE